MVQMKEKKGLLIVLASFVVVGALCFAFGPKALAQTGGQGDGSGPGGVDNIVDIMSDAKLYWNGDDVTDQASLDSPLGERLRYALPLDTLLSYDADNKPPQDSFYLYDFAPVASGALRTENQELIKSGIFKTQVGNEVAIIWFMPYPFLGGSTRALNGKRISSMSFSGLADGELSHLYYDGMTLKMPSWPGDYQIRCVIEDNYGELAHVAFTFAVLP